MAGVLEVGTELSSMALVAVVVGLGRTTCVIPAGISCPGVWPHDRANAAVSSNRNAKGAPLALWNLDGFSGVTCSVSQVRGWTGAILPCPGRVGK
jgi:hypothetical protein